MDKQEIQSLIGKQVIANRDIGYSYDEFDFDESYIEKGEVGIITDVFLHDDNSIDLDVQFGNRNMVYGELGEAFTLQ